MSALDSASSEVFDEQVWVDYSTVQLDLTASWESLCETYDALRFTDPLTDNTRLEEFKWIIKQMNAFLTRIRKKLQSCQSIDSMIEVLNQNYIPEGKVLIENRKTLAYQKLKQRWISNSISQLTVMKERMEIQDGTVSAFGGGFAGTDSY